MKDCGVSMVHQEIFKLFSLYFPDYYGKEKSDVWFANGKNSIRIRLKNKQELIFTCYGKNDWRLETLKCYIKLSKKGENNNE